MTSDGATGSGSSVFVWVWLPGATDPVVAGVLHPSGDDLQGEPVLLFRYAASYRARPDAISLFTPELPLTPATFDPRRAAGRDPLPIAGALRDAAPDAWGRRVVDARLGARVGTRVGTHGADLDERTYLLASGSDRIGALDFQASPDRYVARDDDADLHQLLELTDLVERGETVPDSLTAAAAHGTSIGGARPKALLCDGDRRVVAKFSSSTDTRPVVQSEAVAMLLARRAGLQVPDVRVVRASGRSVLLVDRFDRVPVTRADGTTGHTRRQMVSMLTVLGLWEMNSRYASYAQIADAIRTGPWTDVGASLRELYGRLVLSVLVGNNDDHLRNHSAFWDGARLTLTPAYDLAPQPRSSRTSSQAIGITRDGRRASQLWLVREAAADFLLPATEADAIIDRVRGAVEDGWDDACDQALLTSTQRSALRGREFGNPYVFEPEGTA